MSQFEEPIDPNHPVTHPPQEAPISIHTDDEVVLPNQNLFPIQIHWKDIEYQVEKGIFKKRKENILNMKGSGCVLPGEILAVMVMTQI